MNPNSHLPSRDIVFISKATPQDDEFVLWLAPRLEAEGYTVFADILNLEPGDRWRKHVTGALQNKSIKMLLCCRDSTLEKDGVQEEIGIGLDVTRELGDPRFIIPLRLEKFKKVFGIGELQYIDFVGSWAKGLRDLIDALNKQRVPRQQDKIIINPNWENYKNRLSVSINETPETLTSNWLRISSIPDFIHYYQPTGAIDRVLMESACRHCNFPAEVHLQGFFSFATREEINRSFSEVGRFVIQSTHSLLEFLEEGSKSRNVLPRDAKNLILSMFRSSWECHLRAKGFLEYAYSKQVGFHASEAQVPIGKRIPWGRQEQRRSSMLCNSAGGKVWHFGVSASPTLWPFLHFRFKARVLFAELANGKAGAVFNDVEQQHRLRRSICKGWRNKAWHGRFMAYLKLLSGASTYIELPLSESISIRLDATPLLLSVPVSTAVLDSISEDLDEQDNSTLGNYNPEGEE